MDYSIIIRPLIGAVIGYVTNWIAVKMMFRPLKPIYIGKFTLPFTPGIIPKNKGRLAESIGNTISSNLLTDEDIKNILLSDEVKYKIKSEINNYLESNSKNQTPLKDIILSYISEDLYTNALNNINLAFSNSIYNTVLEANLGKLITDQIEIAAKEKMKGSMLGFLGGNAIISSFTSTINEKLDEYIESNGQSIISEMVNKEITKYTLKSIGDISNFLNTSELDFDSILISIYEKIILDKISDLLKIINISKIVTDKINAMDVLELEKLLLDIMKKELNALVNLGAIIGFILGLFNLLF